MSNREIDPNLRIVTLEVGTPEAMAALLGALGDVAMQHGMNMIVGEPKRTPTGLTERERYNPRLVTWINDPEDATEYPVLTRDNFLAYAKSNEIPGAARAVNTVIRGLYQDMNTRSTFGPQLSKFIRRHPDYSDPLLRAEIFPEFLRKIHPDYYDVYIQNYGPGAARFFAGFAEELVAPQQP